MFKKIIFFYKQFKSCKIPLGAYLKIIRKRNGSGECSLQNLKFNYSKGSVFIALYEHIFISEIYNFSENISGHFTILDCGANIGVATLYFKKKYPNARVISFEPDTASFEILKKNAEGNQLSNVLLKNEAVWIDNNGVYFNSGNDMGSRIGTASDGITNSIKSHRLKDILNNEEKIDFLKLDIEGAESEVIEDCKEVLYKIDKLFIEYHSTPGEKQQFASILNILTTNGFRYYIKEDCNLSNSPFLKVETTWGFDLQLQIFAFKQ